MDIIIFCFVGPPFDCVMNWMRICSLSFFIFYFFTKLHDPCLLVSLCTSILLNYIFESILFLDYKPLWGQESQVVKLLKNINHINCIMAQHINSQLLKVPNLCLPICLPQSCLYFIWWLNSTARFLKKPSHTQEHIGPICLPQSSLLSPLMFLL